MIVYTVCILVQENESGVVIESMDACFGLVRKKSAGKSLLPPRHSLTMFACQEEVDDFVESYTSSANKSETVSTSIKMFLFFICF